MFLNQLNLNQRKAFIELAYITAQVDGIFADEEKHLIEVYKGETGVMYYELENTPLKDCLSHFDTKDSQHILLLELVGLIHSDGKVAIQESDLLKRISEHLGLPSESVNTATEWIVNYYQHVKDAQNFITA